MGNKTVLDLNNITILITGAAGFIGSYLTLRLLSDTRKSVIIGVDNLNDYYDPALKEYRLSLINKFVFKLFMHRFMHGYPISLLKPEKDLQPCGSRKW